MQKLIVRIILTLQKAGDVALWQRLLASRAGLVLFPGACGALTSLGFAPVAVWPFTLAGLSLLFFLLQHARSKKAVFVSTLAFYGVYNTITLWWLNFVMEDFGQLPALLSILIVVLFALYLALPYALLNALAVKLSRGHKGILCMTLLPAAMILSDTVTYYLFTGFPWTYPGYACLTGPLSAFAPLLGVRGINLLLALCAGSIALSVSRQFIYLPAAGVIFMCGVFLSGLEYTDNQAPAKAALVQGNIEQSVKWNPEMTLPTLQRYLQLSAPYIRDNALVVWPESAIPLFMERSPRLLSELNSLFQENKAVLITGIQHLKEVPQASGQAADSASPDREFFNSIIVLGEQPALQDTASIPRYDKRKLVPFGEVVPFASILRPLGQIFNFPMSSFTEGDREQPALSAQGVNFIPAICYESIFPDLLTELNSAESGAILMLSNDSWFGPTAGPLQHLNIARMRSLELQKPMLRATNSGYTVFIDKFGRISAQAPVNTATVLQAEYVPATGRTPFAAAGHLPLYVLTLLLLCAGLLLRSHKEDLKARALASLVRP